jgi:predicted nuclease with TOPRIM domain
MEDINNTPDFTPNTHPVLQALNEKVARLEADLSIATAEKDKLNNEKTFISEQLRKSADKYRSAEYSLTDLLKELITDEDITIENAQRIADIFDNVLLTKRVTIRYDIVATVELEVPFGKDEDEIADNTYCDSIRFDTYESDIEVLEVDYDVTDWNVTS